MNITLQFHEGNTTHPKYKGEPKFGKKLQFITLSHVNRKRSDNVEHRLLVLPTHWGPQNGVNKFD